MVELEGRPIVGSDHRSIEHVHWRLADEGSNIKICRPFLEIMLIGELLQHPAFHHRDPVRQRVGLGLVMGDEDRRHRAVLEQTFQPAAQHGAQLRLELAHRLVQHIKIGVAHQGPRQRCALLLAARNRIGIAIEDRFDFDQRGHLLHPPRDVAG